MKKKVDFLIVYETRVRELENACLLKYELERRGYSVAIINTWNSIVTTDKHMTYNAKVVLAPSMYHDGIYDFVKSIVGRVPKIINLQWEQIGTIGDEEREDCRFILKGIADQCVNICWGDVTVDRLTQKSGFDSKHIKKTGQMALDFCRKNMRRYYLSREELFEQYGIDANNKVNLFISSFSYVNLPKEVLGDSQISDKSRFIEVSVSSFNSILQWFRTMLDSHPEETIIYRPHPAEAANPVLIEMERTYGNRFKVISKESVKQWIIAADRVYTWYSTSAAEAYMCDVPCAILRPVDIPRTLELQLYEGASFVQTYEEFERTLHCKIVPSIKEEIFKKCYYVDETPAYIRVADVAEETLRNPEYFINDTRKKEKQSLAFVCKSLVYRMIQWISENVFTKTPKLERFRTVKNIDSYTKERCENNYVDEGAINEIQARIKFALGK